MNLIKQQQTLIYLITWVTVHNDFWLVSLTCLIIANDWLWPDQLIDIFCLFFLNINNIQHQQLKLFIQKRWTLNLKSLFFFLKWKRVNCPSKLNVERTVPVMLCEQSRSKFCANRPSRIVPGGTGFCANRPGARLFISNEYKILQPYFSCVLLPGVFIWIAKRHFLAYPTEISAWLTGARKCRHTPPRAWRHDILFDVMVSVITSFFAKRFGRCKS